MTKALLNPKPGERWLLVTSSWHMPRAVGVFRKAGFQIEPYPVDWISMGDELGVPIVRIWPAACMRSTTPPTNGSACWFIG